MQSRPDRRDLLLVGAATLAGAATATAGEPAAKTYRVGVISAASRGKPQPRNGHTWHFAQYLHPDADLDAIKKYLDPGSAEMFRKYVRNPKYTFDRLPFPDTKITHYYDADPAVAKPFTEAFPGVEVARSLGGDGGGSRRGEVAEGEKPAGGASRCDRLTAAPLLGGPGRPARPDLHPRGFASRITPPDTLSRTADRLDGFCVI